MKKILVGFAAFAVAFNVTWVGIKEYKAYAILARSKPGPAVRVHGYKLHKKAIDHAKKFTVLISREGFGSVGRGTGVLLESRTVLTCAHLVESWEDDLRVYLYDGTVVKASPVVVDKSVDLAILTLERAVPVQAHPRFAKKVSQGEPLTIIGNTMGAMQWFVSYGVLSGDYGNFYLTDGLIRGGNSGGPWINEAGEIVAITSWGLSDGLGHSLGISGGVSADAIRAFAFRGFMKGVDISIH